MAEVLRAQSRGVGSVEEMWRRYVPSARLDRVDPERFRFDWTSAEIDDFSVVSYSLTEPSAAASRISVTG